MNIDTMVISSQIFLTGFTGALCLGLGMPKTNKSNELN